MRGTPRALALAASIAAMLAGMLAGMGAAGMPAEAGPVRARPERAVRADRPAPPDRPDRPDRFDRCFRFAQQRYEVSALLLKAVARQESGLRPEAVNRNDNGSTDIGLMQINSSWLPTLARHGVKEKDLWTPCVNILVGAWILSSNFRSMGMTVEALGAYNARDPEKRLAYARRVLRHYEALQHDEALWPGEAPRPASARSSVPVSPPSRGRPSSAPTPSTAPPPPDRRPARS